MVVSLGDPVNVVFRQEGQVCFTWQEAAQAAVDILNPSLLPGGARVAEEGLGAQAVELVVMCELGAVVEGDRLAPLLGEGSQELVNGIGHA